VYINIAWAISTVKAITGRLIFCLWYFFFKFFFAFRAYYFHDLSIRFNISLLMSCLLNLDWHRQAQVYSSNRAWLDRDCRVISLDFSLAMVFLTSCICFKRDFKSYPYLIRGASAIGIFKKMTTANAAMSRLIRMPMA
jgi:hypothetical protein